MRGFRLLKTRKKNKIPSINFKVKCNSNRQLIKINTHNGRKYRSMCSFGAAPEKMKNFRRSTKLTGYKRLKIATHIMPTAEITNMPWQSDLLSQTLYQISDKFLEGDVLENGDMFIDFLKKRDDSHIELIEDIDKNLIVGYLQHCYNFNPMQLAPDDPNSKRKILVYSPRLWVIEKTHVGNAIIPYLMMRFSYKLRFDYPDYSCFGLIPTMTAWVSMMCHRRLKHFYPKFTSQAKDEANNLSEIGHLLIEKEMHYAYQVREKHAKNPRGIHTFYPGFHVKSKWVQGGFSDKARLVEDVETTIDIHRNYNAAITASNPENIEKKILYTLYPCDQTNLLQFIKTMPLSKHFSATRFLDEMHSTKKLEQSYLQDLRSIMDDDYTNKVFKSTNNIHDMFRYYENFFLKNECDIFQVTESDEREKVQSNEFITEEPVIDRITRFSTVILDSKKEVTFTTQIWHVCALPNPYRSLVITNTHALTENMFDGEASKVANYATRFKRTNAHIELIFCEKKHNTTRKLVGYIFHEPFTITTNKLGSDSKKNKEKTILILKSGLGCIEPKYMSSGIAPFLIRRYLIKLQLEFPCLPCYNLFRASSVQAYIAFAKNNRDFFPNEESKITIHKKGLELLRMIIDSDTNLRNLDEGSKLKQKPLQDQLGDDDFGKISPLLPTSLVIREEKVPSDMEVITKLAKDGRGKILNRALDLFKIKIYKEDKTIHDFAYRHGQALCCIYPLSEKALSSIDYSKKNGQSKNNSKNVNQNTSDLKSMPKTAKEPQSNRLRILLESTHEIINKDIITTNNTCKRFNHIIDEILEIKKGRVNNRDGDLLVKYLSSIINRNALFYKETPMVSRNYKKNNSNQVKGDYNEISRKSPPI